MFGINCDIKIIVQRNNEKKNQSPQHNIVVRSKQVGRYLNSVFMYSPTNDYN